MAVTDWENILVQNISSIQFFFTSIRNLYTNYSVRNFIVNIKNDYIYKLHKLLFFFFFISTLNKILKASMI